MLDFERRKTKTVRVGAVELGGKCDIAVQSMTNTDTHDKEATLKQVRELEAAGCDIVRITAPTLQSCDTFAYLKAEGVRVPLVADIHFNYEIALAAVKAGADKIRINPGNIGDRKKIRAVVHACACRGVPIRIGVNSGSLEKHILEKYSHPCAEALAESALYHAGLLEELGFYDIVLSVKASNVPEMIKANRILAERTSYPLHLGVTEAGGGESAVVKSAVGIGALLSEGIGDTVRVSLTDNPVAEVAAAREILKALNLSKNPGMDIIACPTCGRTRISLIDMLSEFKVRVKREGLDSLNIKVALMGCAVNGPGEAREADLGIAGGDGCGLLFSHGQILRKVPEERLLDELISEIKKYRK